MKSDSEQQEQRQQRHSDDKSSVHWIHGKPSQSSDVSSFNNAFRNNINAAAAVATVLIEELPSIASIFHDAPTEEVMTSVSPVLLNSEEPVRVPNCSSSFDHALDNQYSYKHHV